MKKIIAAIDFSDTAQELCKFALGFASNLNAELIFVTILDDWDVSAVGKISSMGYNVDGDHYSDEVEHERIEQLKTMIKKCGFPEVEKKLVIRSGKPAREILELIVKENADAVIAGIRCHKDIEHSLELSVSDKLFKKSPVPLISFRPDKYAAKLKKKIH